MNGYIHLNENTEDKNRYDVKLSLNMCTKEYPQILAGTMAAIFGYQSPL